MVKPDEIERIVTVRGLPCTLVKELDEYAARTAGPGGKPSRNRAIRSLLERGLAEAARKRAAGQ